VLPADAVTAAASLDVDVVFADPPYEFDRWGDLLAAIRAPFLVLESGRELEVQPGWDVTRSRRYGRTWVTFLEPVGA